MNDGLNAQKRYDHKKPVVSFRIDRNFKTIINEYMKKNNIDSIQKFIELLLEDFKKRETEYTYKLKSDFKPKITMEG